MLRFGKHEYVPFLDICALTWGNRILDKVVKINDHKILQEGQEVDCSEGNSEVEKEERSLVYQRLKS